MGYQYVMSNNLDFFYAHYGKEGNATLSYIILFLDYVSHGLRPGTALAKRKG